MRGARLIGWLFKIALRLLSLLPLTVAWRLADRLGAWAAGLGMDAARITRINLSKCLPDLDSDEREALTRKSLGHTCRTVAEAGALSHWTGDQLRPLLVEEAGRELIVERLRRRQAVLLLVPHYGNWEFLCYVLGGLEPVALYSPPRLQALEALLLRSRQRFGMRLVPVTRSGLRELRQALLGGGLACILPDQTPQPPAGVFVPFFGQPALTMTLPLRLAQKADAALVLGSARRVPGGFAVRYEALAAPSELEEPEAFAENLNGAIEALVCLDPAQYQWEYKRFKRQPPGYPNPYPKRR